MKTKNVSKNSTQTATEYVAVAPNIYQSGDIYRVRVTVNGTRHSKNFKSKRQAIIFRNSLKRQAV